MSREIKFRAWMENKMLSHEDLVDMDQEFYAMYTILTEPQEDITFMQYTGLKDKYSKEIYEGDIVRVNKLTYETSGLLPENLMVKYYGGMFQFFRGNRECLMGLHLLYLEDGEVIGNIYENPELLEETA